MPTVERVRDFIARAEAGEFISAIEDFYHPDASMQENLGETGATFRRGREALIAGERGALERMDIRARKVERFAVNGDHVFINWQFEMTPRSGGPMRLFDEVSMQVWRGDRIAVERFYYDPAQMRPAT